MTVEELKGYGDLVREKAQLEQQLENIEETILKSPALTGLPSGGGTSDSTSDIVQKLEEVKQKLKDNLKSVMDQIIVIETWIAGLEPLERMVIRERYINEKTWWQVANVVGYCEKQARRIHNNIFERCPSMSVSDAI